MDESARHLHAALRRSATSNGGLSVLLAYLDGLSDVALNARWLARSGHPIANAYGGLGKFLDDIFRAAAGRIDDRLSAGPTPPAARRRCGEAAVWQVQGRRVRVPEGLVGRRRL